MDRAAPNAMKIVGTIKSTTEKPKVQLPKLGERLTEELVIALVGPIGSGCSTTADELSSLLKDEYGYDVHQYKLSDFISPSAKFVGETIPATMTPDTRTELLQKIGDKLREKCGNDYLAAKAIEQIARLRDKGGFGQTVEGIPVPKKLRQVHLIDSIKHPEELNLLRRTYGDIFWLIGVFAPLKVRENRLTFQQGHQKAGLGSILERDYKEENACGQQVRETFHQADYFIRNDQENKIQLNNALERFVEIIFGRPVHTPTVEESSMYAAFAEAAKSACLSRRVGAAIVSPSGELIGVGRNDVPRFRGGLYVENDAEQDHRCYAWQEQRCHNEKRKAVLYEQVISKLKEKCLLADTARDNDVIDALRTTDLKQLIEFSRAVHAEMDAITSVARTHKPGLLGGTLYSTTFPCHSCARHIVASGIRTVFFIEPYPKSLATELHSDAVSESESDKDTRVVFLQFAGIAPKNILKLFSVELTRKQGDGKITAFDRRTASPIVKVSLDDYSTHEKWVIAELNNNEKRAAEGQTALFESAGDNRPE